jgi:Fe-S cluster biogenesis protein NfuA
METPMTLDLKTKVQEVLAREAGPALDMDGTQLEVLDVDRGCARIRLGGVCGNCPSSIMAAVMGIEDLLRKHVPEIEYVEASP